MAEEYEQEPKLVALDFIEAEKLLYEVELKDLKGDEINLWWEVRARYHKKLKEICAKFGTPALPIVQNGVTVEEIKEVIQNYIIPMPPETMNNHMSLRPDICIGLAQAIHDRLKGDKNG